MSHSGVGEREGHAAVDHSSFVQVFVPQLQVQRYTILVLFTELDTDDLVE